RTKKIDPCGVWVSCASSSARFLSSPRTRTRTHQSPTGLLKHSTLAVRYRCERRPASVRAAFSWSNAPICTAHRPLVSSSVGVCSTSTRTRAMPGCQTSVFFAAAKERSTMRPGTNGPRSVIRTTAACPVLTLVTRTIEQAAACDAPRSWRSCHKLGHSSRVGCDRALRTNWQAPFPPPRAERPELGVEGRRQEQARLEFEAFWLKVLKVVAQEGLLSVIGRPRAAMAPSLALACARHTR